MYMSIWCSVTYMYVAANSWGDTSAISGMCTCCLCCCWHAYNYSLRVCYLILIVWNEPPPTSSVIIVYQTPAATKRPLRHAPDIVLCSLLRRLSSVQILFIGKDILLSDCPWHLRCFNAPWHLHQQVQQVRIGCLALKHLSVCTCTLWALTTAAYHACNTHTPGHPSAADEAWCRPNYVLCIG